MCGVLCVVCVCVCVCVLCVVCVRACMRAWAHIKCNQRILQIDTLTQSLFTETNNSYTETSYMYMIIRLQLAPISQQVFSHGM